MTKIKKRPNSYTDPTMLPTTRASTPATTVYTMGIASRYFHIDLGFPTCMSREMAVAPRWNAIKRIKVQMRVNRHES